MSQSRPARCSVRVTEASGQGPLPGPRPSSHMTTRQLGGCAPRAPGPPRALAGLCPQPGSSPLSSHPGALVRGQRPWSCPPACWASVLPLPRPRRPACSQPRRAFPQEAAGRGEAPRTCFLASVLLMTVMIFCVALLHFFRLPGEDSSGSQVFQKCRAASITRALLPAMPANLRGRPGLEWCWRWGPRSALQGLDGLLPGSHAVTPHHPPLPVSWAHPGPAAHAARNPGGGLGVTARGRR